MVSDETIEQALQRLRSVVERHVREQQLRDRLTGLANAEALREWLDARIVDNKPFWLAFIEIDHFKAINYRFGYDQADSLLCKVAAEVRSSADGALSGAIAFREHGDEFYLGGELDDLTDADIGKALDHLRQGVSLIRVKAMTGKGRGERMTCSVSVSWLRSRDLQDELVNQGKDRAEIGLTYPGVKAALERAMGKAKHARNTVVRFDPGATEEPISDGRANCGSCQTQFSIVTQTRICSLEPLYCPHCGTRTARPESLHPVAV